MSAGTPERRPGMVDCCGRVAIVRPQGMSYWRWLLFAAIAHVELREDAFFGLPNATTIRRDVRLLGDPDELRHG